MEDGTSTIASHEQLTKRSRDVGWYQAELGKVDDVMQRIFVDYSKVPEDQVREHIIQTRDKAWDIWPFPCIGSWRFLDLTLHKRQEYPDILRRVQHGERLLDLGCCFGQEVRKLIFDGAPSENLYGSDLRQGFFELGYDLFRDRETCRSTFIEADIFDPKSKLNELDGSVSIVCANSFFHLFDRPEQLAIAKRITALLRATPGCLVVGRQVGDANPGAYQHKTNPGGVMFRHNEQTWRELWEQVGRETETKWDVNVELVESPGFRLANNPTEERKGTGRELKFCVSRAG